MKGIIDRLLAKHEDYEETREERDLEKLKRALEDLDEVESKIDRV